MLRTYKLKGQRSRSWGHDVCHGMKKLILLSQCHSNTTNKSINNYANRWSVVQSICLRRRRWRGMVRPCCTHVYSGTPAEFQVEKMSFHGQVSAPRDVSRRQLFVMDVITPALQGHRFHLELSWFTWVPSGNDVLAALALWRPWRTTGGDWHLLVLILDHGGISIISHHNDTIGDSSSSSSSSSSSFTLISANGKNCNDVMNDVTSCRA